MNENISYEWEKSTFYPKALKDISSWNCDFGVTVIERDNKGFAKKVKIKVLLESKNSQIYVVGDFNDWEEDLKKLDDYKLFKDEYGVFASIELDNFKHKMAYKFILVQDFEIKYLQDPAGVYFDDFGNTIFWDFGCPDSYKQKCDFVDTLHRSTKILQTDLPGLISHFANKKGVCGKDIDEHDYYNFISDSGVIEEIKNLGFNTVQFLPFAQSIDGNNWKFRYLVPFQFAVQKNWGNPDDFARMIDEFHKAGIAIIGDFVLGHLPFKDYEIFGQTCKHNGLHAWVKDDLCSYVFMKEETMWGTIRPDFDNEFVRNFFVSSCLHFMKYYKIDGFRIDNVDGIIRYGPNGDGDERPNGRRFLRELNSQIYSYNPYALIHFEAHYFFGDNAKMLVHPIEYDDRALGATAYNESRLTYFFHRDYMLKAVEEVSVWKFKELIDEKEWGQSSSTVSDFHNHDAAAGLMEMRATGSYAYDTMTCTSPQNHFHALGKIKVMEAIISFLQEGRTLDLLQTFLLQTGTFEHDSSIHWHLTFNEVSRNMVAFKRAVNLLMDDPSFWPMFTKNRQLLNLDEKNKVLVFERSASYNNGESNYVIIVNISSFTHRNYKVGLKSNFDYEVVLNSDEFKYAGLGVASYPLVLKNQKSYNFELLDREVNLGVLAPYGVVVLREKKELDLKNS
ncbi:MAG: alpha amylase C-terminal domain-containing protein [Nanoarchaeota archaeon]|nr:alpha amylase C-terminal domain-containing protein [Nanoarchaeota archaeon]